MRIVEELPLEPGPPRLVADTEAMMSVLAITQPGLSKLKAAGVAVSIGRDSWDLAATVRGYVGQLRTQAARWGEGDAAATLTAERARLAREQADQVAMKNGQLRGELVEATAVERGWAELLRSVRARVLAVPARVRAAHGLDGAAAEAMDRELRDALAELARGDD